MLWEGRGEERGGEVRHVEVCTCASEIRNIKDEDFPPAFSPFLFSSFLSTAFLRALQYLT